MTYAICIQCGNAKSGAFNACGKCTFLPRKDEDLALSLALTDHYQSKEMLDQLSNQKKENPDFKFALDPETEREVIKSLNESGLKRMIGLDGKAKIPTETKQRPARNWFSLFSKKPLRVHILDVDKGEPYTQIWEPGKQTDSATYDRLKKKYKGEVYAILGYEDGKKRLSFVEKGKWDLAFNAFQQIENEAKAHNSRQQDLLKKLHKL